MHAHNATGTGMAWCDGSHCLRVMMFTSPSIIDIQCPCSHQADTAIDMSVMRGILPKLPLVSGT